MHVRKSNSILVPWKSFLFLQQKCRHERCGDCHSERQIERLRRSFDDLAFKGYKRLLDGDLGGCKGDWKNGYEEGRWTSWSCNDMKKILDEAGLPYKDGEETEYIAVSL